MSFQGALETLAGTFISLYLACAAIGRARHPHQARDRASGQGSCGNDGELGLPLCFSQGRLP